MLQDLAGITAGSGGAGGGESSGILPDAAEWEAIERICILLEKFRYGDRERGKSSREVNSRGPKETCCQNISTSKHLKKCLNAIVVSI